MNFRSYVTLENLPAISEFTLFKGEKNFLQSVGSDELCAFSRKHEIRLKFMD